MLVWLDKAQERRYHRLHVKDTKRANRQMRKSLELNRDSRYVSEHSRANCSLHFNSLDKKCLLRAFVAMPFSQGMEKVFVSGIKPALTLVGYKCETARSGRFYGDIMAWIRSRIYDAPLIVANLTGGNPNVYYEVGWADALHKPIILVAQEGTVLGFNVRNQRCIFYRSIQDLRDKLSQELIR